MRYCLLVLKNNQVIEYLTFWSARRALATFSEKAQEVGVVAATVFAPGWRVVVSGGGQKVVGAGVMPTHKGRMN